MEVEFTATVQIRRSGRRFHVGDKYCPVWQQLPEDCTPLQVHEHEACGRVNLLSHTGPFLS